MNNRKKLYVSIGVILSLMILVTIFAFRQEAQTSNSNQANQQEQDDPPTPIQLGVMSEKQKRNSKLFEVNPSARGKKNLLSTLKKAPRGFTYVYPGDPNLGIEQEKLPLQTEFLSRTTCQSDLILIGRVIGKSSQITSDYKSVFTDYGINVQTIIANKGNPSVQLSTITITQLGGSVLIDNRRIDFIVKPEKRFKVGMTYLFFLKYVTESDSFKPANSESAFVITPDRIIRYSDVTPPYKNINEGGNFIINLVRESFAKCSPNGGN